jgi:hypothetical protein
MNLEEQIQGAKAHFTSHTVDKESLEKRIFESLSRNPSSSQNLKVSKRWRNKMVLTCGTAMVALGCVFAVGFASPGAVNIPIIGKLFNLLRDQSFTPPDIQVPSLEGFSQPVHQSVTDHGITLTIGNIYCDQNQLEFDMVESASNGVEAQPFSAQDKNMSMSINGVDSLFNISGGEFAPTQNGGYAGVVYNNAWNQAPPYRPFPKQFQLHVDIHRVGNTIGDWHFVIPVSQARVLAATKVFTPMQSVSMDGTTVTVTKVSVGPGQTLVDYRVKHNTNQFSPSDIEALTHGVAGVGIPNSSKIVVTNNDSGTQLKDGGGGGFTGPAHIEGNSIIQDFQAVFMTPNPTPTSLTIQVSTGSASTSFQVPLK